MAVPVLDDVARARVIAVAETELVRLKLPVAAYLVRLDLQEDMVVVVFTDRKLPPGMRGIEPEHPTLEVEVSWPGLVILKSYFAR